MGDEGGGPDGQPRYKTLCSLSPPLFIFCSYSLQISGVLPRLLITMTEHWLSGTRKCFCYASFLLLRMNFEAAARSGCSNTDSPTRWSLHGSTNGQLVLRFQAVPVTVKEIAPRYASQTEHNQGLARTKIGPSGWNKKLSSHSSLLLSTLFIPKLPSSN